MKFSSLDVEVLKWDNFWFMRLIMRDLVFHYQWDSSHRLQLAFRVMTFRGSTVVQMFFEIPYDKVLRQQGVM